MNEAHITLIGWIAADPFYTITKKGNPFLSLRVGCTPRRFDRQLGQWQDGDAMFLTVNCWRALADNVASSQLKLGDPVIVTGKLRIREYVKDDVLRFSAVIDATTLGHDLTRGHAQFQRVTRGGAAAAEDQQEAEEYNDRFADGELRAAVLTGGEGEPVHWPDMDTGGVLHGGAGRPEDDDHTDADDDDDLGDDAQTERVAVL